VLTAIGQSGYDISERWQRSVRIHHSAYIIEMWCTLFPLICIK
jgi:hypothetical protein